MFTMIITTTSFVQNVELLFECTGVLLILICRELLVQLRILCALSRQNWLSNNFWSSEKNLNREKTSCVPYLKSHALRPQCYKSARRKRTNVGHQHNRHIVTFVNIYKYLIPSTRWWNSTDCSRLSMMPSSLETAHAVLK